jgi:hypothetical protein
MSNDRLKASPNLEQESEAVVDFKLQPMLLVNNDDAFVRLARFGDRN